MERKAARYIKNMRCIFCEGGKERQDSVANALQLVPDDADIVMVHDAARCFVTERIIRDCAASAIRCGSGVAAIPATDTIRSWARRNVVKETLPREELVCVQTPQAFSRDLIMRAYAQAAEDGFLGTDDASLVERICDEVHIVPGSPDNIKLTTRADVEQGNDIARKQQASDIRIGNGFDRCVCKGPQADPRWCGDTVRIWLGWAFRRRCAGACHYGRASRRGAHGRYRRLVPGYGSQV